MTQIRILGAHSSGKTTLSDWISKRYDIPRVDELAREVLHDMDHTIESVRSKPGLVDKFQSTILERQLHAEENLGTSSWVSDRSIDCMAYAVSHAPGANEFIEHVRLVDWAKRIREGITFLCRPHLDLVCEDGVRETPDWVGINRIDASIEMLLFSLDIPFVPISGPSFVDRSRVVRMIIDPLFERDARLS